MKKDNTKKTLVILNDEEDINLLYEEVLEDAGYRVISRLDSSDVTDVLDNNHVDLILSDIIMPQETGIALLKRLKYSKYRNIPFAILNNLDSPEVVSTCLELGACGYILSQAVPPDLLIRVVDTLIEDPQNEEPLLVGVDLPKNIMLEKAIYTIPVTILWGLIRIRIAPLMFKVDASELIWHFRFVKKFPLWIQKFLKMVVLLPVVFFSVTFSIFIFGLLLKGVFMYFEMLVSLL